MIVTCPNCSVRYSASASAIGSEGRKVRCASCGHNWLVDASGKERLPDDLTVATSANIPSENPSTQDTSAEPEPEIRRDPKVAMALRARREAERKKQQRTRAAGSWAAVIFSLLIAITSIWIFRDGVVRIWPNTASVFAFFGAKTNIYGLEIQRLTAVRKMHGGSSVLEINGDVQNISKTGQSVSFLNFQLFDKDNKPVFSWRLQMAPGQIESGKALPFTTEVRDPPPGALRVDVSFANDDSPTD